MKSGSPRSSPRLCRYSDCPASQESLGPGPALRPIVRNGRYYRQDDSRWCQRFLCRSCQRSFSASTFRPEYRQKKRSLNHKLFRLLSSHFTLNRLALHLRIHRKTTARKLDFLGEQCRRARLSRLNELSQRGEQEKLQHLQWDEMETYEHTQLKPLSLALMVDPRTREILGIQVARMPATGNLAEKSRQKYGPRADEREQKAKLLFEEVAPACHPSHLLIETDQNPKYPGWMKSDFPQAQHRAWKGRKPRGQGQGELKRGAEDPLFPINHTAAMLRANVSRLIRKTWTTTKRPDRLLAHLEIYAQFHNKVLIHKAR